MATRLQTKKSLNIKLRLHGNLRQFICMQTPLSHGLRRTRPIVLISNSLSMVGAELRQEASTLHGARRGSFDGAICEHSYGMRSIAGRVVIGSLYAMCIPLWSLRPSASLRRSRLQAHHPSSLSTAVVSVSDQSTTSLR